MSHIDNEYWTLSESEWKVFCTGLDLLRDLVEDDIENETDNTETGVKVFDKLTAEQKLVLLAEVSLVLKDSTGPRLRRTAARDGAVKAVLESFQSMLEIEIGAEDALRTDLRQMLLQAICESEDRPDAPPQASDPNFGEWEELVEQIADRWFPDRDFELEDDFLDLPQRETQHALELMRIDRDFFLTVPDEPSEKGLISARQTLARLIGLPVVDDDGLYAALIDNYHDLTIGPISSDEIRCWENKAWIEIVGMSSPGWDCDYGTWELKLSQSIPLVGFEVDAAEMSVPQDLPKGFRIEAVGSEWVVRDEQNEYWCDLVVNSWTDSLDEDIVLFFPSEAAAKAAFWQANKMYDERSERYERAVKLFGVSD